MSPRFGAAPPWASSVRMTSRASTNSAGRRAPAIAAETMVAESCSPRETRASRVRRQVPQDAERFAQVPVLFNGRIDRRQRVAQRLASAEHRPGRGMVAVAHRPRDAGRLVIAAFDRVVGAVEQQIGDAAERRGHDDQRAVVGGNPSGRARDRLPVGQ